MLPSLYPHQEILRDEIRSALISHQSIIACAPPGMGKTRLSKWILGKFTYKEPTDDQSGYGLFAVHRRGLVDNASNSFDESPRLEHGVIMSGRDTSGGLPIQVGSIDTLLSWFCEDGQYDSDLTFDFIVFDECHSHHTKLGTFLKAHNAKRRMLGLKEPFLLGLSATPQAKGLSDLFNKIVFGPTTQWLIDNKYLSPFRYFKATEGDFTKLKKSGDDFTNASVYEAMKNLHGDLVRDWRRLAEGRATIGFFSRRAHAMEAKELLCEAGVRAEYVDGETPDEERRAMYRALNEGHIDYICNVGVVERGTDIPRVSCVQVCTAVGSVVRWLQMIGRGSRMHPEKTECLVLDHGGNIARGLGFFEDAVKWTLDWTERPSKTHQARPSVECPSCHAIYRGGRCRCGYEPSKSELKSQELEFDGSQLREIKESPKKSISNDPEKIWIGCLFSCGKSNRTFKQAVGMFYSQCRKAGIKPSVPKRFEIAGKSYRAVPYGSSRQLDRVKELYPFTIGDYSRESNRYQEAS